ncbi:glutathione S-transferase family protein [Roseomonas xinghualingensis]|uniref:glutathione S-transferase family protein n=1 Tax=Roseomonas xinghualingensis TaxID=2986475 RepID=UPI0021F1E0FF|nr:glutathione S-transferase family protein [Roseomonas sp. SXEYE001]MCV4207654.1 glutathione S-transferase family protein [Roseomonas sp. SXEYE001]
MATDALTIWGRANSGNVMKVLWLCEELSIPFSRVDAGGTFGVTKEARYLAMNPNSTVPTIEEADGFTLWESNSILRYLASTRHGGAALYPNDPRERAKVDQWLDWILGVLNPNVTLLFWALVRLPKEQRDEKAFAKAHAESIRLWHIAEEQLEGREYLCGAFSIADIGIGALVHRWHNLPLERPDLPRLAAYYERLRQHPGFRQHLDVPLS